MEEIKKLTDSVVENSPRAFKILGSKILVEPIGLQNTTEGGIIIPENMLKKERTITGIIVQIGPDGNEINKVVKVGDEVLYDRYVATELEVNNKLFHLVPDENAFQLVFEK